jgi:hypothetical protein
MRNHHAAGASRRLARAALITVLVLRVADASGAGAPDRACGEPGPLAAHRYTLNVRVRPFLVWIGRRDVGVARIAWTRQPADVRRYELLIGSDPLKTPLRLNRWGYLAETVCSGTASVVGVMTETRERSLEKAAVAGEANGQHAFTAIRASTAAGEASVTTTRFLLVDDVTYRDVEVLLSRPIPEPAKVRRVRLPEGTRPGFMTALAELLQDGVAQAEAPDRRATRPNASRVYTYNAEVYDLVLRSSRPVAAAARDRHPGAWPVESEFELRNRSTRHTTTFRITYGTRGAMAGVPLRLVYRPTWWFEAELVLEPERG